MKAHAKRHLKATILINSMLLMAPIALAAPPTPETLGVTAPGWRVEIASEIPQSYAGWDVEIGDADNDGQNEILTTGCPGSRLYILKKNGAAWETRQLADNLAHNHPGMGLAVKIIDLNFDGKNEIILGTGQEGAGTAYCYILTTDGHKVTQEISSRPSDINKSGYTHNLAVADLDHDGIQEIISAYCGGGEIIRYDPAPTLNAITARKIHHLSGSGEESLITDIDNDGALEFITSNGFRAGKARVEIFEFDSQGELIIPPRITIDNALGVPCFYASIVTGDLDADGKQDMVIGWKKEQKTNRAVLLAYHVAQEATPFLTLENDTEDLDMAYFEKMMDITDLNQDNSPELYLSTRGDNASENITSQHLGRVYQYTLGPNNAIQRECLMDFNEQYAESSWLATGDADNDGKNEIVLATGKGDRTQPGTSYIVLLTRP